MPRSGRLDAPGVLHHIMLRGIERRNIFRDSTDREEFLGRLAKLVPETQTACYAWVLMPNHAHLLLPNRAGAAAHPDAEIGRVGLRRGDLGPGQ
jgi:putative transposase